MSRGEFNQRQQRSSQAGVWRAVKTMSTGTSFTENVFVGTVRGCETAKRTPEPVSPASRSTHRELV